jgi:hypothetical protein
MNMKSELDRIWKVAVVAYFKVLFRVSWKGSGKPRKSFGQGSRNFEPSTFRIQVRILAAKPVRSLAVTETKIP